LYKTRKGFHSVLSAERELLLFVVVYLFTQRAADGHAPIEGIVPEARRMPLYRLINDPFKALQERGNVKATATMADLLRPRRPQPRCAVEVMFNAHYSALLDRS
jgi:hypothetical protein